MKQIWNKTLQNKNFAGFRGRGFVFQALPENYILDDFSRTNIEVDDPVHSANAEFKKRIKETAGIDSARQDRNLTTPGSLESFFISEHNGRLLNPLRQLRMIFMPKAIFGQRLAAGREVQNEAAGGAIGRYSDIENQLDQIAGDDTFRFIRSGGNRRQMAGASLYALGGIKDQIKSLKKALTNDIKIGEKQNIKILKSGTFLSRFKRKAASWLKEPLHKTINKFNLSRLKNTADNLLADAEKSETILSHEIERLHTNTEAYEAGLSARNENNNKINFRGFINAVVARPNDFLTGRGPIFDGFNFEIATGSQNRRHVLDLILIKYAKEVVEAEQTRAAHQDMTATLEKPLRINAAVKSKISGITRIKTDILRHLPVKMEIVGQEISGISEADLVRSIEDNIVRISQPPTPPAGTPIPPSFNVYTTIYSNETGLSDPAKLAYLLDYMQNTLDSTFLSKFDQNTANKIHTYMEKYENNSSKNDLDSNELTKLKTDSRALITSAKDALTDCNNLDTFFTPAEQPNLLSTGLVNIEKFIKDFNNLEVKELIEKIEPKNRGVFEALLKKMTEYSTKLEKVIVDCKKALKDEDDRAATTPPRRNISVHIPSELKLTTGDSIERYLDNFLDPANPNRIDAFNFPSTSINLNKAVRDNLEIKSRENLSESFPQKLAQNAQWQWSYWRTANPGRIINTIQVSREENPSRIIVGALDSFDNLHVVDNRGYNLILQDETGDNVFMLEPAGTNEDGIQKLKLYQFEVNTGDINSVKETASKENADATFTVLSLAAA